VSIVSVLSRPCRYLQGREVVGIPLPPLEVEVGKPLDPLASRNRSAALTSSASE
jgi:hypothetical protein